LLHLSSLSILKVITLSTKIATFKFHAHLSFAAASDLFGVPVLIVLRASNIFGSVFI